MKNALLNMNLWFSKIPDALRPFRWLIIVLTLLGSGVMLHQTVTKFAIDMTFDSFFDDEDPAKIALDEFRGQFGSDDGVFLVYRAKDGNVFSPQSLQHIQNLTDDLENYQKFLDDELINPKTQQPVDMTALNHIVRVQSLSNHKVQVNQGDSLLSKPLVPKDIPKNTEAIRDFAFEQKDLVLFMFSENGEYGAINIKTNFGAEPIDGLMEEMSAGLDGAFDELDFSDDFSEENLVDESADSQVLEFKPTDTNVYVPFAGALRAILAQPDYQQAFQFYPVGNAAMIDLAWDNMIQAGLLLVAMLCIVIILLWVLFKSASAVVWPVLAIVLSSLWVVGTLSMFGYVLSNLIALTVMLILAVGIADCVHVMSTYNYYRHEGEDHASAMRKAFEKTGVPILLTTITTMAGMLALAATNLPFFKQFGISPMEMFQIFGVSSAMGVLAAFIFTIVVLPALMEFWHPLATKEVKKRTSGFVYWLTAGWLQPLLDKVPAFVAKRPTLIAAMFVSGFIACMIGLFQTKIDTNLVELYKEDSPLRQAYVVVDKEMMGTGNLEILVDMQASDALLQPDVLHAIDDVQRMIEQDYREYVKRTFSLANIVKDTHKAMQDGSDAFYSIPDDELAISQLMYLLSSANPEDRRAIVSDDYSRTHITVQMRNAGSYEYGLFFDEMQTKIEARLAQLNENNPDMKVTVTGTLALMMDIAGNISLNQFISLSIAVILISLLLMVSLGSVQAGLIGIIPNLIPATFSFGLMGWLGIPLDTDTLMIAPLIIGIAVDDTIHFLAHYRMAIAKTGDMYQSLVDTIKEVGQAVTFTSLILGVGFFMLSFSDYLGMAKMGQFGSAAIFVALLCDLLFLPAVILIFKPRFGNKDAVDNLHKFK